MEIFTRNDRIYPYKKVASHIVGFSNIDGKGLSGIEKGMEKKLNSGLDISLSIDIRIQNSVRNELIKTIIKIRLTSLSF